MNNELCFINSSTDFARRLMAVTDGCRHDMHEPDNNGVSATVDGDHLDNAMGNNGACGEMFVEITREYDDVNVLIENFNLATLIAFARIGAAKVISDTED